MAFRQKYYREQVDESDCGVACLAMILDYYGSYYSLATLRQQAKTTQEGTTELRLVETAETLGLDVRVVQADMSLFQYNDVSYPFIAHVIKKRTSAFITSHSNMMPLAFESHVKAYDFIAKDLPEKDFQHKMNESLSHALEMHGMNTCRRMKKPDELFNYHYRQRRGAQPPYDQILYIQNMEESHRLLLMGQQGSM